MKKLVNDPRAVVRQMLEGLVELNPALALLDREDVVVRLPIAAPAERPVAVISGGGSGHEPAHAGYVGEGMLAAAVAGDVFTSPSVDAVLAAIHATAGPRGAVLIVKNYTGDRLNFGLAAEMATAAGIPTRMVIVADDAALRDTVERGHRRGIAGTVLVHKVAGAAAAAGLPLDAVVNEATRVSAGLASMGVALGACTVPAAGRPGFSIGDDEMELGLGIHGEQGVRRLSLQPADAIVDSILATVLDDLSGTPGDRVALLVNGLGGTPPMELAIVSRRAMDVLREREIRVERAWCGNFMTALEMPGCSLTLLRIDDAMLARLDAPTGASAWPGRGQVGSRLPLPAPGEPVTIRRGAGAGPLSAQLRGAAHLVADALDAAQDELTALDSRAGDGDLGISMARGAAAIRSLPDDAWDTPAIALAAMGHALRRAIAGSSGPFYATALIRAARHLDAEAPGAEDWAKAFADAVASIGALGGAKPGDRTMLDALAPAAQTLAEQVRQGVPLAEAWRGALLAAEQGRMATASMRPRLGRAAYLGDRALGAADAGASAVVVWMRALAGAG